MTKALDIQRVTVKTDRLVVIVKLADGMPAYTTPSMAHTLLTKIPSLKDHVCANSQGQMFKEIIGSTSIPHVFEHLVIDCQVRQTLHVKGYDKQTFVGTTEWIDQEAGTARIELRYYDDIKALEALNQALDILNETVGV